MSDITYHPPFPENNLSVTWISSAETASLLHLTVRTVLERTASGKLPSKISEDSPFTIDGKQNYLINLQSLPQKAQLQYLRNHLPVSQICALDLTSPRSSVGDAWLSQFLDVSQLIRDAERIRSEYRLCRKAATKELSMLYLDPIYLQPHLPNTMCLWSADFAYSLFLDNKYLQRITKAYRNTMFQVSLFPRKRFSIKAAFLSKLYRHHSYP